MSSSFYRGPASRRVPALTSPNCREFLREASDDDPERSRSESQWRFHEVAQRGANVRMDLGADRSSDLAIDMPQEVLQTFEHGRDPACRVQGLFLDLGAGQRRSSRSACITRAPLVLAALQAGNPQEFYRAWAGQRALTGPLS